jgi:hypothetical protein
LNLDRVERGVRIVEAALQSLRSRDLCQQLQSQRAICLLIQRLQRIAKGGLGLGRMIKVPQCGDLVGLVQRLGHGHAPLSGLQWTPRGSHSSQGMPSRDN